ncbi:branched-chain amino acid transaminase [Candidatus Bathyarchaeota archaeon]|nr:branched-chain amino acid transaminase [Candidatus Bathyarchaeota archaeon]MBS7627669.1 branched-chain amino acid transaminase [Candidatus Bathyarchaeota archaeon]
MNLAIQATKFIWMNGRFIEWDEAKVHVLTHALNYGTGVFEGIRGYAGDGNLYVFRLHDHLNRLMRSAKTYFMEIPYKVEDLEKAILELLRRNELRVTCYIRPLAYRSYGFIGLDPSRSEVHVAIAAFPFGKYLDPTKGVSCCISSWRRIAIDALPPDAKACGNYVNSALAKMEALKNGYDEAIFLDSHGYVCEGTGENIFIVRDGIIATPPLSAGILEGITRDSVIKIAGDMGLKVEERIITRNELYVCDEAFFTGTAAEITPIVKIDGRIVGDGSIGPITRRLQEAFFSIVEGRNDRYKHWLTAVYSP